MPLLVLTGYNSYHFYVDQRDDAIRDHYQLAVLAGRSFERFISEVVDNNRSVGTAITANRLSAQSANVLLTSVKRSAPMIDMFFAIPSGTITASSMPAMIKGDLSKSPLFADLASGRSDWTVTGLQRNADGKYGFYVLTAIRNSAGGLAGVTGTAVAGSDLKRIFPEDVAKGVVVVTDSKGKVVLNGSVPNLGASERDWSGFKPVQIALQGRGYSGESLQLPSTDGYFTGAVVPVPSIGWTVGYFSPTSEALAHVESEALLSLAITLLSIAISGSLAYAFAGQISRPLVELSNRSVDIGKGDFDRKVAIDTGDEIEVLAENFNRMQDNLRKSFDGLNDLIEASKSVNSALDSEAISVIAAGYLKDLLGASRVIIRMKDGDDGKLSVTFADGLPVPEAARIARALDYFMGLAANDAEAISFYSLVDIGIVPEDIKDSGAKALISIPLVSAGAMIGRADLLIDEAIGSKVGRGEMNLAISFCQQVAVALQNARLLERQHYIADVLQKSLLTPFEQILGFDIGLAYEAATQNAELGGDFYDFIAFDDDRAAIVIGDVSGKGIEAARLAALAKNSVRSFASEDPSPSKVMERVNKLMCGETESHSFITLFYALTDRATGETRYSSGGHPPVLFYDRAADEVNELVAFGIPLGIDQSVSFEERRIVLKDGDMLVLFTDGLIEARSGDRILGQEGIVDAFLGLKGCKPAELAPKLLSAAREFAGGDLGDDAAVVSVEKRGAA